MWIFQWLGLSVSKALAQAGGPGPSPGANSSGGITLQNPLACNKAADCIQNVLIGLTVLASPVAAVMILIGGFQIMASNGNEEKVKKGRHTIAYAAVGYAVIILSTAVISVVKDFLSHAGSP